MRFRQHSLMFIFALLAAGIVLAVSSIVPKPPTPAPLPFYYLTASAAVLLFFLSRLKGINPEIKPILASSAVIAVIITAAFFIFGY
ncbi:hypothetical protein ACQU0X_31780 [Pseudovibrio ascidiaceicola]|uniref:hypothetical protein n=1 Tax=Pseudovibrio ascidiaceicola TaxID=285279 RepID=UPI003D36286D